MKRINKKKFEAEAKIIFENEVVPQIEKAKGMKAKLIKETENRYYLTVEGKIMAALDGHPLKSITNKLSLKNCQAIELGYDLDELALKFMIDESYGEQSTDLWKGYLFGFQKALKILGDKKFSEEDMRKAYNQGGIDGARCESIADDYDNYEDIQEAREYGEECEKEFIQSLQQPTEIDVEIVTSPVKGKSKIIGAVKGIKGSGNKITIYNQLPELDADGNLILKRVV